MKPVLDFEISADGIKLCAEKSDKIGVSLKNGVATIFYMSDNQFFRELGAFIENLKNHLNLILLKIIFLKLFPLCLMFREVPIDIFNEYIQELIKITNKYNLIPMMWSDMYFKAISEDGLTYYYGNTYYSFDELKEAIEKYIKYYNEKRIKEKLGWKSPVGYRLSAFTA